MAKIIILKGDKPALHSEAVKTYEGLVAISDDEYQLVEYRQLVFTITPTQFAITYRDTNGQQHDMAEADLVYLRDFWGHEFERNCLALYLQGRGVTFVNGDIATFQHLSKLTQYAVFAHRGIAFPATVFAHPDDLQTEAEAVFDYPMIVKSIVANSGQDNYLVNDAHEFSTLVDRLRDGKFVAQPFIANDGDYRLIVLGDEVSCVYRRWRQRDGEHRNNVSRGGAMRYLAVETVDPAHRALAVRAAQAVGREICGVDLMIDQASGLALILEANFNFGIKAKPGAIAAELPGLAAYLHSRASHHG